MQAHPEAVKATDTPRLNPTTGASTTAGSGLTSSGTGFSSTLHGSSPAHYAARYGHADLLRSLQVFLFKLTKVLLLTTVVWTSLGDDISLFGLCVRPLDDLMPPPPTLSPYRSYCPLVAAKRCCDGPGWAARHAARAHSCALRARRQCETAARRRVATTRQRHRCQRQIVRLRAWVCVRVGLGRSQSAEMAKLERRYPQHF